MGLTDMGESGDSLAQQQRELVGLQQEQARRQNQQASTQAHARAALERTKKIEETAARIKKIRRASWLIRCLPMCGCIPALVIFLCIAVVVIIFNLKDVLIEKYWDTVDSAREKSATYDKTITGVADMICWVTKDC